LLLRQLRDDAGAEIVGVSSRPENRDRQGVRRRGRLDTAYRWLDDTRDAVAAGGMFNLADCAAARLLRGLVQPIGCPEHVPRRRCWRACHARAGEARRTGRSSARPRS
jgi:hypothetical protein